MESRNVLVEGKNCWKIANARRAAFLVDGDAYFKAFASAAERARRSIFIIGWDIDSRLVLPHDGRDRELPDELGKFLNVVVTRRSSLHAYVLVWDFAMIYAFEREFLPVFKLGWRTHRRLRFHMDGSHPVGASHHQKIVVIDDAVAFVGGFDLTKRRWDTSAHHADDPRRIDPEGRYYRPFHDVQMAVDGEAALALGSLARERWRRATGEEPISVEAAGDPWPARLDPDMVDVPVGIARTEPKQGNFPQVREVEALYLDMIRSARRFIYIENQYVTSSTVGDALISRMQEEDGPEIVMVLPCKSDGWLEESTMDVLRARMLKKLRAADRHGRFRVYCPLRKSGRDEEINIHAKILIADDALVRVGSSNLSNRSMGLDTECDLAIEAAGRQDVKDAIKRFRMRLLGEHLGVSPERAAGAAPDSPAAVVDGLIGSERTLTPLQEEVPLWLESLLPDSVYVDPERPVEPDVLIEQFAPEEVQRSGRERILRAVAILLGMIVLALVWRLTPLRHWIEIDTLAAWMASIEQSRLAFPLVMGAYVVGGLVMFPVTLLILATAVTLKPAESIGYSVAGCLLSASVTYYIGLLLGRNSVRRIASAPLNRISRWLGRQGVWAVVAVRIFPVAPYSVVNMVAGASHIRFRDFIAGTFIGMMPGIVMVTIVGDHLQRTVEAPRVENLIVLIGMAAFLISAGVWSRRWYISRKEETDSDSQSDTKQGGS